MYHAKILVKKHHYDEAIQKFEEANTMDTKNKFSVSLGLADCYRLKGEYKLALNNYNFVTVNQPILIKEVAVKKAICLIELKQFEKAITEIDLVEVD